MKQFHIHFFENRKKYYLISLAIILIGLIVNVIFGTQMDIQFTGGAVIKYSFTGEVNQDEIASIVSDATGKNTVSVVINENVKTADGTEGLKNATVSFGGTDSISLEEQSAVMEKLNAAYPDAGFEVVSSNSVNPVMGKSFFLKCLIAVLIAAVLLIVYIALRFRKIGGAASGVTAIVALLHDVVIVYFTFVIFRIPLNDNFIAVILTILGYSLNDTIVVYDRIRENRRLLGPKVEYSVLLNTSINQTLTRSIYTSLATFISVAVVFVVGMIYDLSSITTFALPMMVGVVAGCFSSVCIAGPLYTAWQYHKKNKAEKAA